jgi:hypothetical protein
MAGAEKPPKARTSSRSGTHAKRGRPEKPIDEGLVRRLCAIHCTDEEIAAVLGVSVRTLRRRKKSAELGEAMSVGKAEGRVTLRRLQFQAAQNGNTAMLIWLGKQLLGQQQNPVPGGRGEEGEGAGVVPVQAAREQAMEKFRALRREASERRGRSE